MDLRDGEGRAAADLVDKAIAVVVFAIADLGQRRALYGLAMDIEAVCIADKSAAVGADAGADGAAVAERQEGLVFEAVTVVVEAVAPLSRGDRISDAVSEDPARAGGRAGTADTDAEAGARTGVTGGGEGGAERTFVCGAVAVVVDAVACLCAGCAGRGIAGDGEAARGADADAVGAAGADAPGAGAIERGEVFVGEAVAVVVGAVAELERRAPRHRIAGGGAAVGGAGDRAALGAGAETGGAGVSKCGLKRVVDGAITVVVEAIAELRIAVRGGYAGRREGCHLRCGERSLVDGDAVDPAVERVGIEEAAALALEVDAEPVVGAPGDAAPRDGELLGCHAVHEE